jgi:pimeloyl-ACP methyl ester carboxylesterase
MPAFVHDGLRLWFQESGAGLPVIFLAGILGDHTQWDIVLPHLQGVRAITPENRDIGRSSIDHRDYTARDMAGDVLALMGHLDLDRVSIVGHSLGGVIAQELALLAPWRIDKLVLVCASAQHDIQSRSLMEHWIGLREEIADDLVFLESICLSAMGPDVLARVPLRQAAEIWLDKTELQRGSSFIRHVEALLAGDTLSRLGEIRAETLIVSAECDRIFPPRHSEQLAAGIPGARSVVIERCGHSPMAESPAEFANILQQFLAPVQ